jgi:hypothetical protein
MGAYLPSWLREAVKWIRKPKRFAARAAVALLLILGGLLSFLPVLGLWMLPLGSLSSPRLLRAIKWADRHWRRWRG